MGVQGLLSYCLERRVECSIYSDLVQVAGQQGGIELLVDFYSFEHFLIKQFWKSLGTCSNNPYLRLLGGNYGALDAYLSKFVKDLKSLEIHLVMFVDGAKGSSRVITEQKFDTWKKRHEQDLQRLAEVLQVIQGHKHVNDLADSDWVRPVLLEVQIFETLKECECEVVFLSSGEADYVIAKQFHDRPKAYAILSNDSDFCLFRGCRFIPYELFNTNKDMNIGSNAQWLPEKPMHLMCGTITSESLVRQLELADWIELVELGILAGNDFTRRHVHFLHENLGLGRRPKIHELAAWVRQHHRLENHMFVNRQLVQNRTLRTAVERSREFYLLKLPCDMERFKGHVSHYLHDEITKGNLPNNLMSMHYNFYWHRMLLEDISPGSVGVEVALRGLRAFVYKMVLHHQDHIVVEYGRSQYENFTTVEVYAASDHRIRSVSDIDEKKIFHNLRAFNGIMLHQEPHCPTNFFDKYGRRNGFILLALRYLYALNSQRHLYLSVDEFLAVTACVFCKVDEPWYTGLAMRPNVRCITVANWFQDIYRHAYCFLGKMLRVSHEFPTPKEVFCGAVFTAFYMVLLHEGMLRNFGFPDEWLSRIKHDLNYIIGEKRHVIKATLAGWAEFNTNFRFYVR